MIRKGWEKIGFWDMINKETQVEAVRMLKENKLSHDLSRTVDSSSFSVVSASDMDSMNDAEYMTTNIQEQAVAVTQDDN